MPRPRFTVKMLFAIVAAAAIVLAAWRGLAHAGFTLPPDAVRVEVTYGNRDPDYMMIVAHRDGEHLPLRSYVWKLYYSKLDSPGLHSQYSEWITADGYSLITRDRETSWHMWDLSDSDILIRGGPWPISERTVTITIPDAAGSTTPSIEFLNGLGLRDEVIAGE